MRPTPRSLLLFAALSLLFFASSSASAGTTCYAITGNLIANCGFESALVTSAQYASGTPIPGWTSSGNLDFSGVTTAAGDGSANDPSLVPHSGTYVAFMGPATNGGPGILSQSFSDITGETATLNFFLASECFSGPNCSTGPDGTSNTFSYSIDGAACPTCSLVDVPETGSGDDGSYAEYSLSFLTTGADTLSFAFTNDDDYFALDDISVTEPSAATPEPSSLLLLCTGIFGLALIARSRLPAPQEVPFEKL